MHSTTWHKGTLSDLETAARGGDTWAMRRLSDLYQFGLRGAPQNEQLAAQWLEYAARGGSARAALRLAARYAQGAGVPENHEYAAGWMRAAAQGGMMDAQVHVASELLAQDPNHPEGKQWMAAAAKQGQPYAVTVMTTSPEALAAKQEAFLRMSLVEMAEGAPDDVDTLEVSVETRGPLARIGDALAAWVAEIGNGDIDVEVRATRDDEPVDFPGTAALSPDELESDSIDVVLCLRWFGDITISVGHDGDQFTVSVSGSAPFPSEQQGRFAIQRLQQLLR